MPGKSSTYTPTRMKCGQRNAEVEFVSTLKRRAAKSTKGSSSQKREASSISDVGVHFCIVLLEFDGAVLQEMDSQKFVVARNLIAAAEEMIWVTRHGIQAETLGDHTMINGLARAIRQEKSKMKFVTLAFECEERDGSHFSQSILQVFDQTTTLATDGYEPEYTERDRRLCIDRFVEAEYLNRDIVPRMQKHERETKNFGCGIPLKLSISSPGLLDTLEFIEDKESNSVLEADEIEIKIHASGVNFRDCLIALGRMPGSTFGFECAGTVHRIGEHCEEFVVGERVCANVAGTYQTFGRYLSSQAMPLPDHVSFLEGAALPVTFITAYYALCHVARIRKGESILIHSAAGETGQAAIQIAKLFDAEIYVTDYAPRPPLLS
ncbi:hypothetical protein HYALB_00011981 [Hymenoscyphus albidus]|uniref:Enoyl reductase (ER) domain-containing protein n=1 Tax=Hymenoscyphus albidus TaxID=595503 RepID=A0A9N9Q5E9_9HELO|nr:hypothetical protein HYALB_00011981 [Hymenoscyphus albidus]